MGQTRDCASGSVSSESVLSGSSAESSFQAATMRKAESIAVARVTTAFRNETGGETPADTIPKIIAVAGPPSTGRKSGGKRRSDNQMLAQEISKP